MKHFKQILVGVCAAVAQLSIVCASTDSWSIKADYVDACSCDMTCPCIHGGSPTHGFCKGATLIEIREGYFGDVDLGGVTVLAVYNGGTWIKFVVSENASKEQTEAVVEFLPIAEGFFEAPKSEVWNAPIHVTRTEGRVTIETEGTLVDIEQVKGFHGEPITTNGLPAQKFPGLPYLDHTQFKTVSLVHEDGNESFRYSETNGYTARLDASSSSTMPTAGDLRPINGLAQKDETAPKQCANNMEHVNHEHEFHGSGRISAIIN